MKPKPNKNRKFTYQQKAEAILSVRTGRATIQSAADRLGVHRHTVERWCAIETAPAVDPPVPGRDVPLNVPEKNGKIEGGGAGAALAALGVPTKKESGPEPTKTPSAAPTAVPKISPEEVIDLIDGTMLGVTQSAAAGLRIPITEELRAKLALSATEKSSLRIPAIFATPALIRVMEKYEWAALVVLLIPLGGMCIVRGFTLAEERGKVIRAARARVASERPPEPKVNPNHPGAE